MIVAFALGVTGCTTPYMRDRGNDAADIITLSVGTGAGAKARIGPVQAGLVYQRDTVGLRNGSLFARRPSLSTLDDRGISDEHGMDLNLLICGVEVSNTGDVIVERGKEFNTINLIVPVSIADPASSRLKPHYFFQIEALIGLGPTLRLGVNLGELVDFILGWTTVDIFNDDFESRHLGLN